MEENSKQCKGSETPSPKCQFEKCAFPKTCKWNQRCMQKELEVSLKGKGSFPKKDLGGNAKEK
jgi:hypothetical protein